MNKVRVQPINVYRHGNDDCTNHGISSRYGELLCLCEDGFLTVDLDNPPENLVRVVAREFAGRTIYHVEPVARPDGAGWMMGGNYAATSDSRFSRLIGGMYGAVAIHDRQETWEQYELSAD